MGVEDMLNRCLTFKTLEEPELSNDLVECLVSLCEHKGPNNILLPILFLMSICRSTSKNPVPDVPGFVSSKITVPHPHTVEDRIPTQVVGFLRSLGQ